MEFFQAGHEIKYFRFRRVATGMIILGCLYNDINDIREAAAATTALFHRVINLGGNNELPTVLIKELVDNVPDFFVGDVITTANQHSSLSPSNMTSAVLLSAKEDALCQERNDSNLVRGLSSEAFARYEGRNLNGNCGLAA
jgi:hypothetical protein